LRHSGHSHFSGDYRRLIGRPLLFGLRENIEPLD
jgi:hypothetical protein